MGSKAETIAGTDRPQLETAAQEREGLLDSTREQEIRNRAYEIYLQANNLVMKWMIGFRPNESSASIHNRPIRPKGTPAIGIKQSKRTVVMWRAI